MERLGRVTFDGLSRSGEYTLVPRNLNLREKLLLSDKLRETVSKEQSPGVKAESGAGDGCDGN